jgi:pimeloyl-ACP methyl ester carboxylesterase
VLLYEIAALVILSTGAASAIKAAGYLPGIGAVVSRGGRPDLAGEIALSKLESPSLLIVGSLDHDVIKLNQWAEALMKCEKKLAIVPGASHLFEERGTMEKVCELAAGWFEKYLQPVKV